MLVVVLIAYADLMIGELVPKQLALRDPERVAVAVARPMRCWRGSPAPMVWVLSRSSDLILRLFGAQRRASSR